MEEAPGGLSCCMRGLGGSAGRGGGPWPEAEDSEHWVADVERLGGGRPPGLCDGCPDFASYGAFVSDMHGVILMASASL